MLSAKELSGESTWFGLDVLNDSQAVPAESCAALASLLPLPHLPRTFTPHIHLAPPCLAGCPVRLSESSISTSAWMQRAFSSPFKRLECL